MADESLGILKNVATTVPIGKFYKSGATVSRPTLAAGDVKISIDGGNFANVGTLPSAVGDSLREYEQALAQAETNGDRIVIDYEDAAGGEWEPFTVVLHTATNRNSSLSTLTAAQVNAECDTALSDYDAPTKTELDSGLAAIPAAVWAYSTRTLTSLSALVGSIAAAVWAYASRTLTQSAASVAATVSGDSISVLRGDYWSIALTDIGDISSRTKLYFTVKEHLYDTDAQALIQIEETDGLLYSNGAAAGSASNGSLTVTDESDGDLTIVVKAAETDDYAPGVYKYDLQYQTVNGPTTPITTGTFTITADITRRVA